MDIKIKKLHESAIIPAYSKVGDAGMDLTAISAKMDDNGNAVYYTGLAMEIPLGYAGFIFPRSSVSKYKLSLANSVGVIDSGYRGEIMIKFKPTAHFSNVENYANDLKNLKYEIGDRVAQIIIMEVPEVTFTEVDELSDTERGEGGFGSSGK